MLIKASRFYGIGLTLGAIAAIAACSSDPETPGGGTAGSTSQAGTGTNTAGTGTNTAGTGTNTAGTGTNTAGTGTNTAGTGAGGGSSTACAGVKPAAPLITQFDDLVANPMNAGQFTFTMGVPGGTFSYEKPAITVTDMGKALNAKGMVAAYDGFGLYLNMCTDASAYTGVSFSIKGTVGTKNTLNFRVQSSKNTKIDTVNKKGECVGTTYEECHDAGFDIMVTPDAKVVEVKFSQLAGGLPSDTVSGKDVLGFEWAFPYTVGDAAYAADVTIDDLKFTGGSTGGSGSGGSGGASGGSGGASGGSGGASGGSGGASGGSGGASGGSGGTGGAAGGSGGTGGA